MEFWFGFGIAFKLEISSLCVCDQNIFTHMSLYIYIYTYKCIFEVMSAALFHDNG